MKEALTETLVRKMRAAFAGDGARASFAHVFGGHPYKAAPAITTAGMSSRFRPGRTYSAENTANMIEFPKSIIAPWIHSYS